MRVLILSCNTGEGHNSCAAAVKAEFESRGDCCVIVDALSFISRRTSKFISKWHVRIYRYFPQAFNKGYSFAEEHPSAIGENSAAQRLLTMGCRRLFRFISSNGFDAVVCTHLFSMLMINEIQKRKNLGVKTAFIETDYTASPTAKDARADVFVTPCSAVAEDFAAMGIPKESLFPCGIPVRPMFFEHTEKHLAKENFGIDPLKKHLVIMSGSMGCGPINKILAHIAENLPEECELTVVCGTNKRLLHRLEREYAHCGNINIRGYTKNVSMLMDSADLYLTKPGGISTTEAAVKCLPMVLINAVGGCEAPNLKFFTECGAAVTADSSKAVAQLCIDLLSDENRLDAMSSAAKALNIGNSAAALYEKLHQN